MTHRLGRRDFLHVGCVGGIGLAITDCLHMSHGVANGDRQRAWGVEASAAAAICIVLPGGLAAQESFDPKPQAPAEFRGPFGTVATRVPGVRLGELWRHTARVADKIAICRSVSHGEASHEGARLRVFSGLRSIRGWHWATLRLRGSAGFAHDPASPPCTPPAPHREWTGSLGNEAQAQSVTAKASQALQIEHEEAKIREEYGNTAAGTRLLLCRRLVEAGVRCVATQLGSWDMHNDIQGGMRSQAAPLDQAFASLIRDLDRRGLLDSTLVCLATEFGRSPKINSIAGRDHWPRVFSLVLAGGGIRGGLVHGASDATGSEPSESPLPLEDWAATIRYCLGTPDESQRVTSSGPTGGSARPGQVCRALLA